MVSEQSAALNAIHAAQPQLAVRLENPRPTCPTSWSGSMLPTSLRWRSSYSIASSQNSPHSAPPCPMQRTTQSGVAARLNQFGEEIAARRVRSTTSAKKLAALRTVQPDPDGAQEFFATHLDRLGEQVATLRAGQPDVTSMASTIHARLDELGVGLAGMEHLADRFGRVDNERTTVVAQQIDEVLQAVKGLSDRQTTSLIDVLERFEEVRAGIASTQEATLSVEAALRAAAADGSDERFGELAQQLASMSSDVKSTVRAVVGLGADFTGLRAEVQQLAESAPDDTDAGAETRKPKPNRLRQKTLRRNGLKMCGSPAAATIRATGCGFSTTS